MRTFLLSTVINAVALWLTTVMVVGVSIIPAGAKTPGYVITLIVTAVIFGLVNGTIGRIGRFLAFPLFVLTLGILGLVFNALLLLLVSWIGTVLGFGLHVDGFWSGFWGAIVLSIVSGILGFIFRPASKRA
jgi:putative membrane protein